MPLSFTLICWTPSSYHSPCGKLTIWSYFCFLACNQLFTHEDHKDILPSCLAQILGSLVDCSHVSLCNSTAMAAFSKKSPPATGSATSPSSSFTSSEWCSPDHDRNSTNAYFIHNLSHMHVRPTLWRTPCRERSRGWSFPRPSTRNTNAETHLASVPSHHSL